MTTLTTQKILKILPPAAVFLELAVAVMRLLVLKC